MPVHITNTSVLVSRPTGPTVGNILRLAIINVLLDSDIYVQHWYINYRLQCALET